MLNDAQIATEYRKATKRWLLIELLAAKNGFPWQFEIEIFLIPNKGTPKSKPITWEAIQMALDYGRLRGVGHFRNGMYGRFEWKEL